MKYDVVFEGGGAKGAAFAGALEVFENKGHTFRHLVGTSAGSISATLIASGYNSKELLQVVTTRVGDKHLFSTFLDKPTEENLKTDVESSLTEGVFKKVNIPFIPDMWEGAIDRRIMGALMKVPVYREIFSFIEKGGIYAGDVFLNWIAQMINNKTGLGSATLLEFYEKVCKPKGIDLTLVASDTEGEKMLTLNHRTAPDCPVAWAVRMSMSIPFLWQEVIWKSSWGKYLGEPIDNHTIVDGGVLSNFPIDLIAQESKEIMGDDPVGDAKNLGLLIDEKIAVPNSGEKESSIDTSDDDDGMGKARFKVIERVKRLVGTMMTGHDNVQIEKYADEICHLPAASYGTVEFNMSPERMDALVQAGKKAMEDYFLAHP